MPRNRRAVWSTLMLCVIVALTGSLILFLGSAAQASGRPTATVASKVKVPSALSELLASDAWPGDGFGWSVSVSGSTAVVGAPYASSYTGAAYIFSKAGGTWTQQAELTASDAGNKDEFGWSVSISGSTVVVGAPGHYYGIGAAYVFSGSGGTWTQAAELSDPEATGSGDVKFGYSVLTSGAEVLVGADGDTGGQGAVYDFTDTGGTWTEQQRITASDGVSPDEFGWSMTLSGSTLVVSAVRHDATGAIYVFTGSPGNWTQQAELKAIDGFADDYFGDKVAISGTRIVAGAPGHDNEQGAAYVFSGSGANWKQVGELTASDGEHNDCFGWAVGLSGKTILVGAEQTNADSGAAYVFKKAGAKWLQKSELTAGDGNPGDEFGYSAALSGTTAIIGADNSEAGAGSAYIYTI